MDRFSPFPQPLRRGTLLRRYKRFLADIELDDGTQITAHCPNSGSMLGMKEPGSDVAVLHVPDPKRKLKWTWEMICVDGAAGPTWVGNNTMRPNQAVRWAIEQGHVPGLDPAHGIRAEVKYGEGSRIDLMVGEHHVEIKNTTLAQGPDAEHLPDGLALFPDAVTARGAKHMDELRRVVEDGGEASVVFFVNRADCDRFGVADDIDPTYGAALRAAHDAGVRVVPLGMDVSPDGWTVRGVLPYAL